MSKLSRLLAGVGVAAALAAPAHALDFVLASHVGDAWTYTLVFDPYENMSFNETGVHATITLSGLSGVTAITGPTSTDFPIQDLINIQLAWTGEILDGGSTVVFTNPLNRSGTGNPSTQKHTYGFTLIAPGSVSGEAAVATNGFYYGLYPNDGIPHSLDPANDRDIDKAIAGPVSAPVPEPATWALMILGLGAAGGAVRRRRAAMAA